MYHLTNIHWGLWFMVVMTAKLSKKKLLCALAAIAALVILLVCCLRGGGSETKPTAGEENDARLAFLSSFGYTVNGEPTEVQQMRIPQEPSEVFERYNALQKSQGYDLSQYAGQTLTRYVYALENYDDTGACWYATVLEYQGEIVGGDVACGEPGGIMHGFVRPST